jgi:hypothetical protein
MNGIDFIIHKFRMRLYTGKIFLEECILCTAIYLNQSQVSASKCALLYSSLFDETASHKIHPRNATPDLGVFYILRSQKT